MDISNNVFVMCLLHPCRLTNKNQFFNINLARISIDLFRIADHNMVSATRCCYYLYFPSFI